MYDMLLAGPATYNIKCALVTSALITLSVVGLFTDVTQWGGACMLSISQAGPMMNNAAMACTAYMYQSGWPPDEQSRTVACTAYMHQKWNN